MGEDTTNFAMQCELRYYWELHVCHEGVFTPFIKIEKLYCAYNK